MLFVVDGNETEYNGSFKGKENVYKKDFIDILKEKSLKYIDLDTTFLIITINFLLNLILIGLSLEFIWALL